MKKIEGVKVITKLIVSSLIVFLIIWLGFEASCYNSLYEDYCETCNKLERTEERFNKLWEIHLEVMNNKGV